MKITIRRGGIKLTEAQKTKLEKQLSYALARFGESIACVIVRLSGAKVHPGYNCHLQILLRPPLVTVEHSDLTISLAVDHAATRAARSVRRAIEKESWTR